VIDRRQLYRGVSVPAAARNGLGGAGTGGEGRVYGDEARAGRWSNKSRLDAAVVENDDDALSN